MERSRGVEAVYRQQSRGRFGKAEDGGKNYRFLVGRSCLTKASSCIGSPLRRDFARDHKSFDSTE